MERRAETARTEHDSPGLLIAGRDRDVCRSLADLFIGTEYTLTVTNSALTAVNGVLRGMAQVILLADEVEGRKASELVPLLKKCNPALNIILVSEDAPVALLRKLRRDGIFYHALRPTNVEDGEEIRQAVRCAFENTAVKEENRPLVRKTVEPLNVGERRVP